MQARGLPYDAEDHSAIKRAPMPPSLQPPPAVIVPAAPGPLEAEHALFEAFDWGRPLPPMPRLKGPAALDYRWLRAAATFDTGRGLPANPYATGSGRREAEAFRRLTALPQAQLEAALKALPLRQPGTALALWRWGQLRVRSGSFPSALRRIWEDRLLTAGPALTRGYALRHALCWALAEQDEARLAEVRSRTGPGSGDTLKGFQRLFGLLGGPSPELRLWTLPGLEYQDLRLDQLGSGQIWFCPPEDGPLPDLPAGIAWIIPSLSGNLDEREASLTGAPLTEGQALATRLRDAKRAAHFAPSRKAFEQLGLAWFPILIEVDDKGNLRAIRMGDAAPGRP